MKAIKENWLLYLILIIGLIIIYIRPNDVLLKEQGKDLKHSRDSTYTIKHEREIVKEKTKTNITNIINEIKPQTNYYTSSDSLRLIFCDSFLSR